MNIETLRDFGVEVRFDGLHIQGHALNVYQRIEKLILTLLSQETTYYPALIEESVLERSGYLNNFSHQLISIDGKNDLFQMFLRPAACLEWYEQFRGQNLEGPVTGVVVSACSRAEKEVTAWRLPHFHMVELVILAVEDEMDKHLERMKSKVTSILEGLELPFTENAATDAFFLGQDSGSQMMQKIQQLKMEYQYTESSRNYALASRNNHKDYFGNKYSIMINRQRAHSACLAFGIERLMMATIMAHEKYIPITLNKY